jgi:hypothetical protein
VSAGTPPKRAASLRQAALDERWARVRLELTRELGREHQCHDESCDQVTLVGYRLTQHLRHIVEGPR